MRVREYGPADLDRILDLYRGGKPFFELPHPGDPHIVVKKCMVDEQDVVRVAGFARLQTNAFLVVDHTWATPAERLEAIEVLEFAMIEQGRELGVDQVTAQVPVRWGRRLEERGWQRSIGVTYHKEF